MSELTQVALPLLVAPPWYSPGVASVLNADAPEDKREYTCTPREAVLATYAQVARRDWNTWSYEARYGALVRRTRYGWLCARFWCYDPEVAAASAAGEGASDDWVPKL